MFHAEGSPDSNHITAAPLRVGKVSIKDSAFKNIKPPTDQTVLWQVLNLCASAEQRTRVSLGNNKSSIPAALTAIHVEFPVSPQAVMPIMGPLTTNYPKLTRSLRALKIARNDFDESTVLGTFATLATHLETLTFSVCGLTSLRGLAGHCKFLRAVDVQGCKQLRSLEGLEDGHGKLEDVIASVTAITSVEPLLSCPAMTKVFLIGCERLSSLEGLQNHQWLENVNASFNTALTSVEALRTCPALRRLFLHFCTQLPLDLDLPANITVIRKQ